jgi:Transposase
MKMRSGGSVRVLIVRSGDPGQGLCWETQTGRPFWTMGVEPGLFGRPLLRLVRIGLELVLVCVVVPLVLPLCEHVQEVRDGLTRWVGRATGLDGHRDFYVVAIREDGRVRSAGRVPSTLEGIRSLAKSLLAVGSGGVGGDGQLLGGVRMLGPYVDRVVVVSPDGTGIASARAKTDKLDARALALLLWCSELAAVWMTRERCRILRRRLARREQLVHSRSRSENEIQACLQRRLQANLTFSDLFGVKGREWLAALELPLEERESSTPGCVTSSFSTPRSRRWRS